MLTVPPKAPRTREELMDALEQLAAVARRVQEAADAARARLAAPVVPLPPIPYRQALAREVEAGQRIQFYGRAPMWDMVEIVTMPNDHTVLFDLEGRAAPVEVHPDDAVRIAVPHQPRERDVPCRRCRRKTWAADALCDPCRDRDRVEEARHEAESEVAG